MAAHTACESAESLTLGTACHLRERERERERERQMVRKAARLMAEGTQREWWPSDGVSKYVFPKI